MGSDDLSHQSKEILKEKDPVKVLFVGGVAGCVAKTVIAPLEMVRLLVQTANRATESYYGKVSVLNLRKSIIDLKSKRGGIRGLYQGHSLALLRIFPYSGTKFMSYELAKSYLIKSPQDNTRLRQFSAGAIAGIVSVFCCYPLELVHVRMATTNKTNSKKVNIGNVIRSMKDEALYPLDTRRPIIRAWAILRTFYLGFTSTLIGAIPYSGVGFSTYNTLKMIGETHFPHREDELYLKKFDSLLYGAISGLTAQTFSYPIEVIRRTMQARTLDKSFVCDQRTIYASRLSLVDTTLKIYQKNGIRTFYQGLILGYAKVIPSMSISFFVYELGSSIMGLN